MSDRPPVAERASGCLGPVPLLTWSARATGLLLLGLVLGVMHNDGWESGSPDVVEAFERAFLYVLLGSWLVGLRWRRIAGVAGAFGFVGLQMVRWWVTGAPSFEPGVVVLVLPSLLHLLAWRVDSRPIQDPGRVLP